MCEWKRSISSGIFRIGQNNPVFFVVSERKKTVLKLTMNLLFHERILLVGRDKKRLMRNERIIYDANTGIVGRSVGQINVGGN